MGGSTNQTPTSEVANWSIEDFDKKYGTAQDPLFGILIKCEPGQTITKDRSGEPLKKYGIEWIKIVEGGIHYKFQIRYKNLENCGYKFVCGEPDYYDCSSFQMGEHYIDYNSKHATLYYVGT